MLRKIKNSIEVNYYLHILKQDIILQKREERKYWGGLMIKSFISSRFDEKWTLKANTLSQPYDHAVQSLPEHGNDEPLIILINNKDMDALLENQSEFIDRGKKNPKKPLKSLMFGYYKIPAIRTGYKDLGKFKNAVDGFMRHVKINNERKIYILGITEELFFKLQLELNKNNKEKEMIESDNFKADNNNLNISERVLNDLKAETIPEKLDMLDEELIGSSRINFILKQVIVNASKSDCNVLLTGETGVGKTYIAKRIHSLSAQKNNPFCVISCASIPSHLLEAELFGYRKGAFTGAVSNKKGLWEQANGGTLFLDEIGELPLEQQGKILRALRERKIQPIGSMREISVNARIIAATNRDLEKMVAEKLFRADLLFRINHLIIRVPPLRMRKEDFEELVSFHWKRIAGKDSRPLSHNVISKLKSMPWKGNIAELEAFLKSMHTYFGKNKITSDHINFIIQTRLDYT